MADSPGRLRKPGAQRGARPRPPLVVDVHRDVPRAPIAADRLAALVEFVLRAEGVRRATVSLTLLGSRRMARLNREQLGHRGPTDVISFGFDDGTGGLVADLYVCPDVARTQAAAWRVGVREELARLVVHGTLHACGWDHPAGEARLTAPMWRRQERLLARAAQRLGGRW